MLTPPSFDCDRAGGAPRHGDSWAVRRPGDLFMDEHENVYIGEMYYQKGVGFAVGAASGWKTSRHR